VTERFSPGPRTRAALYIAILAILNAFFVRKLFFVDFTRNMQTNAGSFMAISRFLIEHWPHIGWFPYWLNGIPFENTYSPMLQLIDAGFAVLFHCSTARAFNFVTGFFYVLGPVTLFVFAWRFSRRLETSFAAALVDSLFSWSAFFPAVRADAGGWWNPWRLRVLVHYGEGPHIVVLGALMLALLCVWQAISTRKYAWCAAAGLPMAFLALVNAFGLTDLAIGCACLVLALDRKQMGRPALIVLAIAAGSYLLACPYLTPSVLRTLSRNSQWVGGDFRFRVLFPNQCIVIAGGVCVWLVSRRIRDRALRFALLFAYAFFAIVGLALLFHRPAMPQPHRYTVEMGLAMSLLAALALRPFVVRLPPVAKLAAAVLFAVLLVHQTVSTEGYAASSIQKLDITRTAEYQVAKWMDTHMHGERVFASGPAGLWLNVFTDTPQMHNGHSPFNPNFFAEVAAYTLYVRGKTATQAAVVWLEAFGNHAVHVTGAPNPLDGAPFQDPHMFDGLLPVLWRRGDDAIYSVPQIGTSLAHVVPAADVVARQPINGLDTAAAGRYVAAIENPAFPAANMVWARPDRGRTATTIRPGQVLSVQVTYDNGWIASANGRPARVTRDGLGLMVVEPHCNGPCAIQLIFDGGIEREACRAASCTAAIGALAGGIFVFLRRRRESRK
jgi:hypothetical protein